MLEDYAEVKDRIAVFYERYPEGNLATVSVDFVTTQMDKAGGVLVRAQAWRNPEDSMPASGTGWCPIPGSTKFEQHREVQNAETSAWGRTLEAMGIPRKRSALIDTDALNSSGLDAKTARDLDLAYRGLAQVVGPEEAKAITAAFLATYDVQRFDDLTLAAGIDVLARVEEARLVAAEAVAT